MPKRLFAVFGSLLWLACVGSIGEMGAETPSFTPQPPRAAAPASPGSPSGSGAAVPSRPQEGRDGCGLASPARLWRLAGLELQNTLEDLIGPQPATDLDDDPRATGFSTSDAQGASAAYVSGLKRVAESAAAAFRKTVAPPQFAAGCFAADDAGRACARDFIRGFGRRAFRRPIADADIEALLPVYDAGRNTGRAGDAADRFRAGVEWTVRAILQSPHFIYRIELGGRLGPYELASALSYALTASPPDADLLGRAESLSPAMMSAEVDRLIAARPERFRGQVRRLVTEWLGIDFEAEEWGKRITVYRLFTRELKRAFEQELGLFLDDWIASGPTLGRLLTSSHSFVGTANAPIYGVTAAAPAMQKTALDPTQRAGVLTLPAFLGTHAHIDSSGPIPRGVTILKRLLCKSIPPPPPDVPPAPDAVVRAAKTTRQLYENRILAGGAPCVTCHSLFNPMGYAFEAYDGIGVHRKMENGVPVDTSGAIVGTERSDRPVANAIELVKALGDSPEVHECLARQAFRYTLGRRETDADRCTLDRVTAAFSERSLDVRDLLRALVTSEAFQTRVPPSLEANR